MPARRPTTTAEVEFAKHASELSVLDLEARFARIHATNLWADDESRSGVGSNLVATAHLRSALPQLLTTLRARVVLDVPCGDFGWMSRVNLGEAEYVGGDIVPELVRANQFRYGSPRRSFVAIDLTRDPLPSADVILCRDCLVHLSYANIAAALDNVKRSGAEYFLTTSFPGRADNCDVADGNWRPLDFEAPPFSFPPPLHAVVEGCRENDGAYADKSLLVWRTSDLRSIAVD